MVAETGSVASQRDETLTPAMVVLLRLVAIARNRNQQQAAGPAHGEGERLSEVLDRCLHCCEYYPILSLISL